MELAVYNLIALNDPNDLSCVVLPKVFAASRIIVCVTA